jgi:TonB-dependent SusC/RagA subfamily outer membrane receptor
MEEEINGRTTINFEFGGSVPDQANSTVNPGDEAVNVGYGTVRKSDMTTNVNKIDGTNPKYASYRNIYDMIKGEVPGVQVTGTSIKIQGISSMNSGTEPLFVLDGVVVNSIGSIQPAMVKSIEILKGAAASIYGSRGANGVILINLVGTGDK